jgi:hypothetical protein
MAIRLRDQEFGPEVEAYFREVFYKIRSAVQDLCYSYRDDPSYETLSAPYREFATTTDNLLRKILYATDAATKKVLVLDILAEIEKVATDLPTFGPTLRELVDQLAPVVAELRPPSDFIANIRKQSADGATLQHRSELEATIWDLSVWLKNVGKPADVAIVTLLQAVAIQWLAVRNIQEQAGPNYTGRIKAFVQEKPALTDLQRQTRTLREGALVAVDRELREARGKLTPLKESAEHKRSQIKAAHADTTAYEGQVRDLYTRKAQEINQMNETLKELRNKVQDLEKKLHAICRTTNLLLKEQEDSE